MNSVRSRLIVMFLAVTLIPLGVTLWITSALLESSLSFASTAELDQISRSLESTGRELYQRVRDDLKQRAVSGKEPPLVYQASGREGWPPAVEEFFATGEPERYALTGKDGDRLEYFVRHGSDVRVWNTDLGGVALGRMARQIARARDLVDRRQNQDLRRGFTYTYALLGAAVWIASLIVLVYLADRISRPIRELTVGLGKLEDGDLATRVVVHRDDEIGRASMAFNHMAAHLQQSTERLLYLTQLASWRALARKMAHEVKNSLTPIRLTVEELLARHGEGDRAFMEQASQIVVDEVESLERRVRAFSEFAAEPPVRPAQLDVTAMVEERVAFLRSSHPEISYEVRLGEAVREAWADPDLVKGILTNLLENAAQAAGEGGRILAVTGGESGRVTIEVHDSGPGLPEPVKAALFQPTISFKKGGMGLGLSIARRSALLSGGDIQLVKGELGGAGFRVLLPTSANGIPASPDRG